MRGWVGRLGGVLDAGKELKDRSVHVKLTCFFKLISTIRSLAKPEDLPKVDVETSGMASR